MHIRYRLLTPMLLIVEINSQSNPIQSESVRILENEGT